MSAPDKQAEQRSGPRVPAGCPGRLHLVDDDGEHIVRCLVIDASRSGARLMVNRSRLPAGHDWRVHETVPADFGLGTAGNISCTAEVVWIQHERDAFDILGVRFEQLDDAAKAVFDTFLERRGPAGDALTAMRSVSEDSTDKEGNLKVPLRTYVDIADAPEQPAVACRLTHLSEEHARIEVVQDEYGHFHELPTGVVASVSIHPPGWCGLYLRTIHLEGVVVERHGALEYTLAVNQAPEAFADMVTMIRNLVPPDRPPPPKPDEGVNWPAVLLAAVAVIVILLVLKGDIFGRH